MQRPAAVDMTFMEAVHEKFAYRATSALRENKIRIRAEGSKVKALHCCDKELRLHNENATDSSS